MTTEGPSVVAFSALLALAAAAGAVLALTHTGGAWLAVVTDPWYAAFLIVLLLAQWLWPARQDLPGAGVGLGQDAVWFVLNTALAVTVVAAYLTVVERAYTRLLGGWSLDLGDELGAWGLPVAALVVTDLMAWTSHYLHHKVPVLWAFHAVHHSSEAMNVFSDSRQHVIETMVTATMVFLPARVLGLDAPGATGLAFLSLYVGAFIHANIRTNLGPARFLLISPQAHRVHHSAAAEHIDTNFGVILAGWDHLFGTRYPNDDEYPTTGIHDRTFPLERRADPSSLLTTWGRQLAYPFRHLASRHSSALQEARAG
jgi:sterol desaturase/sphingolipid hydroxylase (fatty acid hydroxylase superfamily)